MSDRETDIIKILSGLRNDLYDETLYFLNNCTNKEIQEIMDVYDTIKALHIETLMCKLVLENRISIDKIPSWEIDKYDEIYEASRLDVYKRKHLPEIRKNKINKLLDNDK